MPRENAFVNAFPEGKHDNAIGKMSVRTNQNAVRIPSGCNSFESARDSPHNNKAPAGWSWHHGCGARAETNQWPSGGTWIVCLHHSRPMHTPRCVAARWHHRAPTRV